MLFLAGSEIQSLAQIFDTTNTPSQTAGTLFVDLRADTFGGSTWTNFGTLANFNAVGTPSLVTNVAGTGVNFYWDLGIMFQGSPKASLSAACGPSLNASQCAQLQNDVATAQRGLEDDVKRFKYYPVANIGITIGF